MEESQMVESNQTCDSLVHSLMRLLEIQDEIDSFNEHMIDELLEVEEECIRRCKPLYDKRNEVIKSIPHFWRIVCTAHPVFNSDLDYGDHKVFSHFTSLEVEEFRDGKSGYSITLIFEANPYFEDTKLTKTFTFLDERTTQITATPIRWKDGVVPNVAPLNKQKIRPLCYYSFFTWFSLVEEKVICEDFEDKIADIIKEDLWRNPFTYFKAQVSGSPCIFLSQCSPKGDKADDGMVNVVGEVDRDQINAPLLHCFEILLELQDGIDKINDEAVFKQLQLEDWHNKMCNVPYHVRNQIIRTFPDFWQIVFLSHPVLTMYITEEDEKIFKHLTSLEVEGYKDHGKSGYFIRFKFGPNPYFENTELIKAFTFHDERNTEISATSIKWKEDMVPTGANEKKGHQMGPMDNESFFMWFSLVESKNMIEGLADEIADCITEDLWPNPLSYFYSEPDGDERVTKRPRLGDVRRGTSSCGFHGRRRAIRLSKYISEPRKLRSLELKRRGSSHIDLHNHARAMAKYLQNHKKCGQFERSEGEDTLFQVDTRLVTRRMFGCPIIRSFSMMLSEYYREKYGLSLEVLEVLRSVEGQSFSLDRARCAKWFHLNFRANVKDGDDVSEKLYFAELLVFRFWFSFLHCHIVACLPLDIDASGPCKCLFSKQDPEIYHPSVQVYVDDSSLAHPTSTHLWYSAQMRLEELADSKSRSRSRSFAWFIPPSRARKRFILEPAFIPKRRNETQAPIVGISMCRYQSEKPTKMSRDIPVPKLIMSFEKKRQGISDSQRQRAAYSMASCIENYRKPWPKVPKVDPLIIKFTTVLPECYKRRYGVDLVEVHGLKICEVAKFEPRNNRRNARWFHMNFVAKIKEDDGQLYFAEVVEFSCMFNPKTYNMSTCIAIDQNDFAAGNSSKCGICKSDLQICHPNSGSYLNDPSKMNPFEFPEWEEAGEYLRKLFWRGPLC